MKRIKLLSVLLLIVFINSTNVFSQQKRLLEPQQRVSQPLEPVDNFEEGDFIDVPIGGGTNPCTISITYNNQPLTGIIALDGGPELLTFNITTQYCYEFGFKLLSTDTWITLPLPATISRYGGVLSITIPANNTPFERYGRISIVEDDGSGLYSLLPGGNIRINQQGDPNLNTYYLDSDKDSFGNHNGKPIYAYSAPPSSELGDFVTNNLDLCPTEHSLLNNGCVDNPDDQTRNWVKSISYDIKGKLLGASKGYYDDLGKQEQSQSYDIKDKRTWANQVFYDSQGRPALQTLSAPITPEGSSVTFGFRDDFVKNNNGTALTTNDIESEDVINSVIIKPDSNPLGTHYANREAFQDQTSRPYSKTIYSALNPGGVKQVIGGNKQDTSGNGVIDETTDSWKRGYSFSMPAAQEMYYVYVYDAYPINPSEASTYPDISTVLNNTNNNHIVWLKAGKSVVQDDKGNESVAFTDADGKTLGAARSGGTKKYEVLSLIGAQKFVDIHIPIGCNNTASLIGNSSDYKIYDLTTELPNGDITKAGFYRIEYIGTTPLTKSHQLTYIDKTTKTIQPVLSEAVGIRYKVNYYDFSLNYYNIVGQLTSSLQPLGFDDICLDELKATAVHNDNLKSYYSYNSLGQLIFTKSPDEGEAAFKYRKDGQIRFSQNSKQKDPNEDGNFSDAEFSYTNYDELGRPVESGVFKETSTIKFSTSDTLVDNILKDITIDDDGLPNIHCTEQQFTQYDYINDTQKAWLTTHAGAGYENPTFLSGNVARTFNDVSETYYSYDVYGRVKWIVQKNDGLNDAKTIDYEYDPLTSQVTKVYFEKDKSDQFIHIYSYDADTQQLVTVETSTNNSVFTEHAAYEYYKNGALKRTTLAKDAINTKGIQDIDYVYNLNGQLKGINHPDLTKDPILNPNETDLFGLQLDYHVGDYTRDDRFKTSQTTGFEDQYNGNIKAMTWNSKTNASDISKPLQYKYKYDENNWMKEAIFDGLENTQNSPPTDIVLNTKVTSTQDKQATNSITLKPGFEITATTSLTFSAKIGNGNPNGTYGAEDYNVDNITYDTNGNILSLHRNKNTEGSSNNKMDELAYTYKTDKPNQLDHVLDAIGDAGVEDIDTQSAGNYIYNSIGQLIENKAENVKYQYNASGLVTKVLNYDIVRVVFNYNDKGYRSQKLTYNASGSLTKTTNYVLDASGTAMAIYEDGVQKEIPIYGASRLGIYKKASGTSVYQLTDHLGNVRAVIAKNGANAVAMSKTDYYPFGMAMPNRKFGADGYRYGYQGQEVDPETGKEAFQLRLWDARIGRWLTTDPYSQYNSPYLGMGNNPMNGVDPDGGLFGKFRSWLKQTFSGGRRWEDSDGDWHWQKGVGGKKGHGLVFDEVIVKHENYGKAGPAGIKVNVNHFQVDGSLDAGFVYKRDRGFKGVTAKGPSVNLFKVELGFNGSGEMTHNNLDYIGKDGKLKGSIVAANFETGNFDVKGKLAWEGGVRPVGPVFVGYINVDTANSYIALGRPLTEVKMKDLGNKVKRSLHFGFQEEFGSSGGIGKVFGLAYSIGFKSQIDITWE